MCGSPRRSATLITIKSHQDVLTVACVSMVACTTESIDENENGMIEEEEYINIQIKYFMSNLVEPAPMTAKLEAAYVKLEEGLKRMAQQYSLRADEGADMT